MPRRPTGAQDQQVGDAAAASSDATVATGDADALRAELAATQEKLASEQTLVAQLQRELEETRRNRDGLQQELEDTRRNRDGVTAERSAMWRDYCRLRDAMHFAFPAIHDPDAKAKVKDVLDAGQSH